MPQRAPRLNCACASGAQMPRTLAELEAAGEVTQLDGDLEVLALIGTQLDDALITTNNGAALLSGMGGLAPFQSSAAPFRMSSRRVTLRVRGNTAAHLVRTAGRAGDDAVVNLLEPDGAVSLRIEANSPYDRRILCSLEPGRKPVGPRNPIAPQPNIVSLCAVRAARNTWAEADIGLHLNDLLGDGGARRCATLPHIGRNRVWPVQKQVILSFLTFLANKGISHARLVPGYGFLQGDVFRQGATQLIDQVLLVSGAKQNFALDLSQVHSAWVVRTEHAAQLELYSSTQQAIAILAPDPAGPLRYWNDLLASLPMAHGDLFT